MSGIHTARRRFTLTCLLLAGATVGCSRLADHPLVEMAKEEVTLNERARELLGEPVNWSGGVTGRANEVDGLAAMQIPVSGPRATGVVVVEGKKFDNEWGVTMLEIRPEGDAEKVSLTADLAARIGVNTPKFDPNAEPTPASNTAPPPAEVSLELPDLPPGISGTE